MIALVVVVVILAALLQVSLSSLTILGVMPAIALLVAAWIGYRAGAAMALPLMVIAGFVLSFFVASPVLIISAYFVAGLILAGVIAVTRDEDSSTPLIGSVVAVAAASVAIILIVDGLGFDALSVAQIMNYILLSVFATVAVWWLMLTVSSPNK